MTLRKFTGSCLLVLFAALVVFQSGCGKKDNDPEKILVEVNNEPIFVKDFNRALALSLKRNPMFKVTPQTVEDVINMLVDRKLLVQQAQERKLHRTEKFINTIQTFWEQTLIRDLLADQDKGINSVVSVSDKEVEKYYKNLSFQKTFQISRVSDKEQAISILKGGVENIEWQETLGPFKYDDLSPFFMKAFEFPKGSVRYLQDGDDHYIVKVKEENRVKVGDINKLRGSIIKKISGMKKKELFDEWLNSVKGNAEIKINRETLKGMELKS